MLDGSLEQCLESNLKHEYSFCFVFLSWDVDYTNSEYIACECFSPLLFNGSKWPWETNLRVLTVDGFNRVGAFGSYWKPHRRGISCIQSSIFSISLST
jgi:hypothetical protein